MIVDIEDSAKPQRAFIALTSQSATVLDVGGVRAIRRGFELGGKLVTRLAAVELPAGRVRVVARVAQRNDGNFVEINTWGEDGLPLKMIAPNPGDPSLRRSRRTRVRSRSLPKARAMARPRSPLPPRKLGLGEARFAEHLLEPRADGWERRGRTPCAPDLELLYARAIEEAGTISPTRRRTRICMRGALDKVLTAWPAAWEAKVAHARLTERRRGAGDGPVEALKELGIVPVPRRRRARAPAPSSDATAAITPHDRMVPRIRGDCSRGVLAAARSRRALVRRARTPKPWIRAARQRRRSHSSARRARSA